MRYIRRCNSYNVDLKYNMVFDPKIAKLGKNKSATIKLDNRSLDDRLNTIFSKIRKTRDHSDYNKSYS